MSKNRTSNLEENLYFYRLSLERCHVYLTHIYAALHVVGQQEENLLPIVKGLEQELDNSARILNGSG